MDRSLRRSTLGPMSTADVTRTLSLDDSRLSLGDTLGRPGPSRQSIGVSIKSGVGPKAAIAGKRDSIAPGGAGIDRRASILSKPSIGGMGLSSVGSLATGGAGSAAGGKADPRPVNSKQFQSDTIQAIGDYCLASNYRAGPMSAKILASPTGKDFTAILLHLCQRLDANFAMAGRIEDEAQAVFKTMRYPFTLSKTSLTAVGSPTTYPAILAALGWLVELLIYDAAACEADPQLGHGGPSITAGPGGLLADGLDIETLLSSTTGGPGDSGFFFNAVTESYNHFLAGEDDACEVIDGKVAQAFELKHKGIEGELERMRQQNEAMKQELAAMRSEKSPLPSLTSQQSLLKQEIDQETRRVKDLEHQRDALNAGLLQHSKILKDKERTVESLHSSLSEISKAIAGQELSQQDVDRLASRKSALREEHASLQQSLYEAKQLADNAEVALKRALNELSARLSEYHSSASKLQLLPSSAKYAFGLDYGLKVNEAYLREVGASASYNVTTTMMGALDSSSSLDHDGNTTSTNNFASATTTSLLLGNDVKTSIKPNLRELKAKMIRQANDQSKQGIELADAIHSLNEAIAESQRTAESLSRSIRAKEDALASAKQEHEAALQQQQGITDSLTQQLSKTRQELSQVQGTLGQVKDDAVTSASLKLRTYTQVLNDTRMRARLKFQDCLEVLARHKDTVVEKLEALRAKVQSKRDAELAAPPPRETLGGRGSSSSSSSSSSSAAVMAAIAANKAARMQSVAASTIASSTSSSLVGRLAPPTPFDDTAPPAPVTTTAAGARQPLMAAPSTSSNNSNNPVIAAIGRATIGGGAASSKPFVAPPTVPHPQVSAAAVAPPTVLATATTNRHLRFEEM